MSKLQLWELTECEMSAELFELALKKKYDMEEFYKVVMSTELGDAIYRNDNAQKWMGGSYVLSLYEDEYDMAVSTTQNYSLDAVSWIGYMLRYWFHYRPQDTAAMIYNMVSWEHWVQIYVGYHCVAPELTIDDLLKYHNEKSESTDLDRITCFNE